MTRFAIALACLASLGLPLAAQDAAQDPAAPDAAAGGQLFFDYCAACHGADATGTGPLAEMLAIAPPDLTGLAARNGGVFPTAFVVFRIDGRNPLAAHGGDMPVFGRVFEGEDMATKAETGQPMLTSRPIVDLVAWLEGVQG